MRSNIGFLVAGVLGTLAACAYADASFATFDRRAAAGEPMTVVFFGASLTWGANATDQMTTSYRARIAERLEARYPRTRFRCYDAAIGGTGSQLGAFRLERDVLRRKPDLVFLDFSANDDIYHDDPETLASYEAIVRRLVADAGVPVVQVLFPFKWNVTGGSTAGMKRRDAHLALSQAYGTACGDAIELAIARLRAGETTADALWPVDGIHPGDTGYHLFADAAWGALTQAVARGVVCRAPEKMVHADTYLHANRTPLATLFGGVLPNGWRVDKPRLTSACFDMQMSRWLDDEATVSRPAAPAAGATNAPAVPPAPLRLAFRGSMVLAFGESTPKSGLFRITIDGHVVEHPEGKASTNLFNAGYLGGMMGNTAHLSSVLVTGLDPTVEHALDLEPVLAPGQELRIESLCIAGGAATLRRREP